jgi:hypothetical protein
MLFVPIEAVGLRSRHIIPPLRDGKDSNFTLIVKYLARYFFINILLSDLGEEMGGN